MRRFGIFILAFVLTGCSAANTDEQAHHTYATTDSDGVILSVYSDGQDVTGKESVWKQQTENAIAEFLNRPIEDLQFDRFSMLEEDGMTIDVTVGGVAYTFICGIEGDIVSMARADGERFGVR